MFANSNPPSTSIAGSRPSVAAHHKLKTVSSAVAGLCFALALVLPLSVLTVGALGISGRSTLLAQTIPGSLTSPATPITTRLLLGFLLMLPVLAAAYSLVRARACFLGFAKGEYFNSSTAGALRGFAAGMAASQLLGILVGPLCTLLMIWFGPPEKGKLAINLGSQQLLFFLFAAMVWVIAGVMAKGEALAEENAQFV